MPAKVRVYELAKELDVTNKEIIALCESLGIDAKSHSSSLVEAQADRVRKKAVSDGIAPKKTKENSKSTNASGKDGSNSKEGKSASVAKPVSSKKPPPSKTKPPTPETQGEVAKPPVVSSKKASTNPDPDLVTAVQEQEKKPKEKPLKEKTGQVNPKSPPISPSGKPIPPPPAPKSKSGRPIPPPPGRGGRGP